MTQPRHRSDTAADQARLVAGGLIAILRGDYSKELSAIAETLLAAGVTALEVTLDSPGARQGIASLADQFGDQLLVGAGTVLDHLDVAWVRDVGGRFIVAPDTNPTVIETAHEAGLLAIPGAFTPTEVLRAWQMGASLVKLFPAMPAGPDYLRALRGPLADIPIVPTGGIDVNMAAAFMQAGAAALGAGSSLVSPDIRQQGGLERLRQRAQDFVAAVRAGRPRATRIAEDRSAAP